MGFKLGNDYMAWVSAAQAGTYTLPAGQQDGTLSFSFNTFDASTKDSGGFSVKGAGLADVSFSLSVEPNLPDANGYTLIQNTALTYPRVPLFIKVRKNGIGATDADTIFGAAFWVTSIDVSMGKNAPLLTPFKFDLAVQPFVTLALA